MNRSIYNRATWRAVVAVGIAIMPAPALAMTALVQPGDLEARAAKAQAILGVPSRLSTILAEQQGLPVPQPIAYAALVGSTSTAMRDTRRPAPSANRDRPDVFGSVALSVRRTPLDQRWRRVAQVRVGGAAAAFARSLRGRVARDRVDAVNRYVNGRVRFVDDASQYGREDMWAAASETLRRGRGDCEDSAIAKLQLLRTAGMAEDDLYLVIAKDLIRRADHALLVVRAGGRMMVLDNSTDRLLDAEDASDYRPMLTFSTRRAWTHGYRTPLAPTILASAAFGPLAPAVAARAD